MKPQRTSVKLNHYLLCLCFGFVRYCSLTTFVYLLCSSLVASIPSIVVDWTYSLAVCSYVFIGLFTEEIKASGEITLRICILKDCWLIRNPGRWPVNLPGRSALLTGSSTRQSRFGWCFESLRHRSSNILERWLGYHSPSIVAPGFAHVAFVPATASSWAAWYASHKILYSHNRDNLPVFPRPENREC